MGLGELVAEVGHEVADRAEQTGRRRHDHREGAHQLRHRVGVQRPGAAVGDEREVARVVTALHRDEPQRAGHVLVDDGDDPLGRLLDAVEAHRVGDLLHRRPRGGDVERHLAAEQARRQVPSTTLASVTVGSSPPLPYAAGPGSAPGRLRADAKRLRQLRHVRDRPAAGADRVHVDRRAP